MKNERIQVFALAAELHVAIADIQHALHVMELPERQHGTGWISGQHAEAIRRGLRQGAWRPWSRPKDSPPPPPKPPAPKWSVIKCPCCQQSRRTDEENPQPLCARCIGHQDDEHRLLQDHLDQAEAWISDLRKKLNEMEAEKNRAFASRDSWRRTLVELMLNHAPDEDNDDVCLCGEPYPCTSRQLLPALNKGIASEVARFEDMHPAEREAKLSGERWSELELLLIGDD